MAPFSPKGVEFKGPSLKINIELVLVSNQKFFLKGLQNVLNTCAFHLKSLQVQARGCDEV